MVKSTEIKNIFDFIVITKNLSNNAQCSILFGTFINYCVSILIMYYSEIFDLLQFNNNLYHLPLLLLLNILIDSFFLFVFLQNQVMQFADY